MICVNSVTVSPKNISLKVGSWSYAARAEICPYNADCKEVTWRSNNTSVATVNASSGYIYAKAVGSATIYATATDGSGCSDYLIVTVSNTVPVTSVTLNRSSLSLEKGQTSYLYATVCPDNASNKNLNWTSSNTGVATVSNGIVTAVSKGSARITATAADGSGKSASCTITVTGDILVSSISVSPTNKTMTVGNSAFLTASVCPTNATKKSVCWSSSDTNIVAVNELTGLVMAQNAGTVTIYATACDGSGAVGCCCITVKERVLVSSITVSPKTKKLNVNASATLSATVCPSDATDNRIRWSCEQTDVVSVDSLTGKITGISVGTATVKAVACDGSGVYDSCKVTVATVPVTGVSISPTTYTMEVGDSVRFAATVSPSNATDKAVTWRSSDTSVATVTSGGCVTAKYPGNTTITVTTKDGVKTASCNLTVKAVDTRETVTIEKDDEDGYKFFKATFKNGLIWESVGVERTLVKATDLAYSTHFRRANANSAREYSDQQLSFLYRLDPLGVEYYVNTHTVGMNLTQILEYRDRIYKSIFGNTEDSMGHFRFKIINGNVVYGNYGGDRTGYYTNAEVLFGSHLIPDWSQFWHDICLMVFGAIPGVSALQLGAEIFRGLFFSSSLVGTVNGAASDFFEKYCDDYMKVTNDSLHSLFFGWPRELCEILLKLTDIFVDAITPENINDITIYNEIDKQSNYRLVFSGVSLTDIIERCN